MFKKIISLILCFIFLFQNIVVAGENWVRLEANNKSIDINTSNFGIFNDYISIFAKAKVKNDLYLYNLHINCDNKTIIINDIKKITNDKEEIIKNKEKELTTLPVKPNSLNEKIILYIDETTKYDIRRQDWNDWFKYHIKVMKKFNKEWNPKFNKKLYNFRTYITCELTIDKKGNITKYVIDLPESENFQTTVCEVKENKAIINSIEDTIIKIKKFDKLPKKFKGDNIKIKLAFIYKYNSDDINKNITETDYYGYKILNICKIKYKKKKYKSFSCYKIKEFFKDAIIFILVLPFAILIGIFEALGSS